MPISRFQALLAVTACLTGVSCHHSSEREAPLVPASGTVTERSVPEGANASDDDEVPPDTPDWTTHDEDPGEEDMPTDD